MAPWLRFLEAWLVAQLLRTPAFHRGVEKVARSVQRIRHGIPPEEMGGTKIEQPRGSGFTQHFLDELKAQLRHSDTARSGGVNMDGRVMQGESTAARTGGRKSLHEQASTTTPQGNGADSAWREAQKGAARPDKPGFLGEYVGALREQFREGKTKR